MASLLPSTDSTHIFVLILIDGDSLKGRQLCRKGFGYGENSPHSLRPTHSPFGPSYSTDTRLAIVPNPRQRSSSHPKSNARPLFSPLTQAYLHSFLDYLRSRPSPLGLLEYTQTTPNQYLTRVLIYLLQVSYGKADAPTSSKNLSLRTSWIRLWSSLSPLRDLNSSNHDRILGKMSRRGIRYRQERRIYKHRKEPSTRLLA
jgi:hypothetical protein